jgi:phage-related protein
MWNDAKNKALLYALVSLTAMFMGCHDLSQLLLRFHYGSVTHQIPLELYARLGIILEMTASPSIKPVAWIGSARADLASFPEDVKDAIGYALYIAQSGGKHTDAKPLRGFGGAGILEILEHYAGDAYRAVYTVRLAGRIYVFQKKSKTGIKTPKQKIELIRSRLKRAEEEHARWLEAQKGSQG